MPSRKILPTFFLPALYSKKIFTKLQSEPMKVNQILCTDCVILGTGFTSEHRVGDGQGRIYDNDLPEGRFLQPHGEVRGGDARKRSGGLRRPIRDYPEFYSNFIRAGGSDIRVFITLRFKFVHCPLGTDRIHNRIFNQPKH